MPKPFQEAELRAAKLSRVPGVTNAQAAARFGVSASRVSKARRDCKERTEISLAELALAALTDNGLKPSFELSDLQSVANYIDYVNHDGCRVEDVRRLLESLAERGVVTLTGTEGKLLVAWP